MKFTIESFEKFRKDMNNGDVKIDEFKKAFQKLKDSKLYILQELSLMTKAKLLEGFSGWAKSRYKAEKKERVVEAVWDDMMMVFVFGTFSYSHGENEEDVIERKVNATTQEDIDKHVADYKKRVEEYKERMRGYKKSLENPETLEEFKFFFEYKGKDKLTTEQLAAYEKLIADKVIEKKEQDIEKKATVTSVDLGDVGMELHETKHTKLGYDLFVVKLTDRVERDKYNELNIKSKKLGGWYSSYTKGNAVAGFQFKEKEQAEKFMSLKEGDVSNIEKVEEKLEKKQEKKAEKLRTNAQSLIDKANEDLSRERQVNTSRRANMAAHAEDEALKRKQLGETMMNLADAVDSGEAKYLSGISAGTHVELLNKLANQARYIYIKDKYAGYQDYLNHKDDPVTEEMIGYLPKQMPPRIYRDHVVRLIPKVENKKGLKLIANRFNNLIKQTSGEWVNLNERGFVELYQLFTALPESDKKYHSLKYEFADFNRLKAMGIENDEMLKTALREFVQYRANKKGKDPLKEAERKLAAKGKHAGIDFFPTPPSLANKMVELADIKEGDEVLEPSAGNGNIADAIKNNTGVLPDVIEISSDLKDILELKGYNVVGSDFLEFNEKKYDKILMNPPFGKIGDTLDSQHVRYAYEILKPGGRIVSIVGAGIMQRSDKKSVEFQEWVEKHNGEVEDIASGTFMDRTQVSTTGTATKLIVIDKPLEKDEEGVINVCGFKKGANNELVESFFNIDNIPVKFPEEIDDVSPNYGALFFANLPKSVKEKSSNKIELQTQKNENDMDFGINTKVKNYSYDNEKDQNWYISDVSTDGLTVSHKRFGTRKQMEPIEMTWPEFKELIAEQTLEVEGFDGDNIKHLNAYIKSLLKDLEIIEKERQMEAERESERRRAEKIDQEKSEREAELARAKRYEKAVKMRVEKKKNYRISEREKLKQQNIQELNQIKDEMERESKIQELRDQKEMYVEMISEAASPKKKQNYQDNIDMIDEMLSELV